jgi:hypothetical protein
MSIATVITRGYGSFGSVNRLPTLGYGTVNNLVEVGYTTRTDPAHYTVIGPLLHYTVKSKPINYTLHGAGQ